MNKYGKKPSVKDVIEVHVKATVTDDGIDLDVQSDRDTAEVVTVLFLGLMASYGLDEDEAKEVFDVMFDKIDAFRSEGVY